MFSLTSDTKTRVWPTLWISTRCGTETNAVPVVSYVLDQDVYQRASSIDGTFRFFDT